MAASETPLTDPDLVGHWDLIPEYSTVAFKNKTFWGARNVTGTFSALSGDGHLDSAGGAFGRLTIGVDSLRTGIAKRDEHLQSPDYFDVESYPEIRLVVTAAAMSGPQRIDLRCRLTIKAITEMISVPGTVALGDDGSIRISGRACLNRNAFGVSGNMAGMVGAVTAVSGDLAFRRGAP